MPRESRVSEGGPTLADLMTTQVVTLSPHDSLRRAVEVLASHRVSGAPVVVGQEVVGVLSATDIIALQGSTSGVPAERPDQVEWGEWGDQAGREPSTSSMIDCSM